jgi:hypothetical protein
VEIAQIGNQARIGGQAFNGRLFRQACLARCKLRIYLFSRKRGILFSHCPRSSYS